MGAPRRLSRAAPARRFDDEFEDFDRQAENYSEAPVTNVSPYVARFQIATVPGSSPRNYKLDPGQTMNVQRGYTAAFVGASMRTVRPTIESMTEREAWPGKRGLDKDGKVIWLRHPGPRLPMVVSDERVGEVSDLWSQAIEQRAANDTAPLRMTLQRTDGSEVEVEADVERTPPIPPQRGKAAPKVDDDEDQIGGPIDPPPPEHDDPDDLAAGADALELPVIPAITPAASSDHPDRVVPTRAEAKARKNGGG